MYVILCEDLLTYSMVQSPSWEANWFAASQEIPRLLWNPKVHYRTHKRPPPVPILGQPNPVHMPTSHLLEIHPNIIHPSTPRSPQWSLSLRFPHQDPIHLPLLTHTRHMPSPSHSSRFYHPHNIGWGVQIINLLVMQSPPFPRYLVPPRSKHSPQHHILKHPQLPFLPQCQRPGFTPIHNNRQNYSSIYFNLSRYLTAPLSAMFVPISSWIFSVGWGILNTRATTVVNRLTPNDSYMGRTAPLTSKHCILYIYSTNMGTEYFKHALYSPFFLFKMQFVS